MSLFYSNHHLTKVLGGDSLCQNLMKPQVPVKVPVGNRTEDQSPIWSHAHVGDLVHAIEWCSEEVSHFHEASKRIGLTRDHDACRQVNARNGGVRGGVIRRSLELVMSYFERRGRRCGGGAGGTGTGTGGGRGESRYHMVLVGGRHFVHPDSFTHMLIS